MCRSLLEGGRRCAGAGTPEHRNLVNSQRRAAYAALKDADGTSVRGYRKTIDIPIIVKASSLNQNFNTVLREKWDASLLTPVSNATSAMFRKPEGGLWTSPVRKGFSAWQSFLSEVELHDPKTNVYNIAFHKKAKILVINSKSDYMLALDAFGSIPETKESDRITFGLDSQWGIRKNWSNPRGGHKRQIDYARLAQYADGIYVTARGLNACGSLEFDPTYENLSFHNWDLPSLLIFNADSFEVT
jgi:hypothetical protein